MIDSLSNHSKGDIWQTPYVITIKGYITDSFSNHNKEQGPIPDRIEKNRLGTTLEAQELRLLREAWSHDFVVFLASSRLSFL